LIFLFDYKNLSVYTYNKKMDRIKVSESEISLFYEDRTEKWVKSTSCEPTSFIKYDNYTYILKSIK
jgi:hypothetical protein